MSKRRSPSGSSVSWPSTPGGGRMLQRRPLSADRARLGPRASEHERFYANLGKPQLDALLAARWRVDRAVQGLRALIREYKDWRAVYDSPHWNFNGFHRPGWTVDAHASVYRQSPSYLRMEAELAATLATLDDAIARLTAVRRAFGA